MAEDSSGIELEFHSLHKVFGTLQVLKNFNLRISPGEFVAIVGRSGCGKSTLLRIAAGLTTPTDGDVWIDGNPVAGIDPGLRYLFQEHRLLPWKTVLDNVRLGLADRNANAARMALGAVGLAGREAAWPSVLSGGQKQRVALARALVGSPRLLLLDEPLGALDALTRIEMQQLIEDLWLEKGFTVILVTHDVAEAVSLADRVLLIDQGSVSLDLRLGLSRPRVRDNDFVYFERQILDRVLGRDPAGRVEPNRLEYAL